MMRRSRFLIALVASVAAGLLALPVAAQQPAPTIELDFVSEVVLGQPVDIDAFLRDSSGRPVAGETVTLAVDVEFLNVLDTADAGWAITDDTGRARLVFVPKIEGELYLTARFEGSEEYEATEFSGTLLVTPGPATYEEPSPFRIPGANIMIVVVVLITVWSMFLVFVGFLWLIARDVPVERAEAEPRA